VSQFLSAALSLSKCVDPLADKYPNWTPYNYTLNNPVRLVDPDGMEAEDEWEIHINKNGTTTVKWISDKGGDEVDHITVMNDIPIPQKGAIFSSFSVPVEIQTISSNNEIPLNGGLVEKGPGYRIRDAGSNGAIKPVYPEMAFMPLPKLGILERIGGFFRGLFGKSAAEESSALTLKALGRGSTGRTTAKNLIEQLTMKEIKSNPYAGRVLEKLGEIEDPRWKGWMKMQYIHKGLDGKKTIIHFNGKWVKGILKAVDDFKFK